MLSLPRRACHADPPQSAPRHFAYGDPSAFRWPMVASGDHRWRLRFVIAPSTSAAVASVPQRLAGVPAASLASAAGHGRRLVGRRPCLEAAAATSLLAVALTAPKANRSH